MSSNQHAEAEPSALDTVASRALFDRVKASQAFSRSPRLRQLLDYLCDQSMADPGLPLTEERIGVEVFGRSPGYDTGGDTIVRVQVSQLRKRLEHYFLSEGASETRRLYFCVTRFVRPRGIEGRAHQEYLPLGC